jgi:hypothetical protein
MELGAASCEARARGLGSDPLRITPRHRVGAGSAMRIEAPFQILRSAGTYPLVVQRRQKIIAPGLLCTVAMAGRARCQ